MLVVEALGYVHCHHRTGEVGPIPVKGTSSLSGKLTVEVLNASGKQIGSKQTTPSDGRFSVAVPFTVKQLVPAAVLVHDEGSDHSVQIQVALTP